MTREFDPRLIELIGSIDDSRITDITLMKKERQDLLVSCESGWKHLIRFEEKHISLIQKSQRLLESLTWRKPVWAGPCGILPIGSDGGLLWRCLG